MAPGLALGNFLAFFLWLAVGFLPDSSLIQSPSADKVQDFHVGVKVEMVSVFATVHDRKGKVVKGLTSQDFMVYDNGAAQNITQFSREYMPLSVAILVDISSSMSGRKLDNSKKSLVQFLRRLNPGDEAMLMTFNSRPVKVQDFTSDLDRIRRSIRKLDANGSTALYDAILRGLGELERNAHNRRRVLLLISDGINTYGDTELKQTIDQLRRSSTELFAIGIETDVPEEVQYNAITNAVLEQLTSSAGGESFVVTRPADLESICDNIADRMHHQYTFAYYPPEAGRQEWHDLKIEAKTAGLRVIASKTGYYPAGEK